METFLGIHKLQPSLQSHDLINIPLYKTYTFTLKQMITVYRGFALHQQCSGQWRKKLFIDSMSPPQIQIGFIMSLMLKLIITEMA